MRIDEKLAKGLTTQFMNWIDEDMNLAFSHIKRQLKPKHFSRSGMVDHVNLIDKYLNAFMMTRVFSGSKRSWVIGFTTACPLSEWHGNGWSERAVTGRVTIIHAGSAGASSEKMSAGFLVGEHAIARIYQRSGMDYIKDTHYAIMHDLRYIPMWQNMWRVLLFSCRELGHEDINRINPVIPTESGLMLCKQTTVENYRFIEVRTFVGKDALRPDQKEVRDILLYSCSHEGMLDTALSLFPFGFSTPYMKFESELISSMIIYMMMPHLRKICSVICRGDEALANRFYNSLNNKFSKKIANNDYQEPLKMLEEYGASEFVYGMWQNSLRSQSKI